MLDPEDWDSDYYVDESQYWEDEDQDFYEEDIY